MDCAAVNGVQPIRPDVYLPLSSDRMPIARLPVRSQLSRVAVHDTATVSSVAIATRASGTAVLPECWHRRRGGLGDGGRSAWKREEVQEPKCDRGKGREGGNRARRTVVCALGPTRPASTEQGRGEISITNGC